MGFGVFFCFYSVSNYSIGSAFRMGPGYFPAVLGGFLFVLGLLTSLSALLFRSEDPDSGKVGKFDWFSSGIILASVTVFGLTLRPLGMIPATAVMIFIASMGQRPFKLVQTLLVCLVLSTVVWLIFVLGLNLQVPIWPQFLISLP